MVSTLTFLAVWAPLALCSGLLLVDDVPLLLVYVTFGLAAVLFPIPTVGLYATSLLPSMGLVAVGARKRLTATLALLGLSSTALLPGLLAEQIARIDQESLTADDAQGTLPRAPRELRERRPGNLYRSERVPEQARCLMPCQNLLYGGEADAVEVRVEDGKRGTASVVWRRETRSACPDPGLRPEQTLPFVQRAIATGDCLVGEPGATLEGAPWYRDTAAHSRDRASATSWALLHRLRGIRTFEAGAAEQEATWRRTEVVSEVVNSPTVFWPASFAQGLSLELRRSRRITNPTPDDDGLRLAFGYALVPLPEPGVMDLAAVGRILDRPGDEPLGESLEGLVREAVRGFIKERRPPTEAELEVLGRIAADPRIDDAYEVVDALKRHPTSLQAIVPQMVARFEAPVPDQGGHTHARFAFALLDLPEPTVRPHVPALQDALDRRLDWTTAPLLVLLPRYSDDVGASLDAALASSDERIVQRALEGLCEGSPTLAGPRLDRAAAVGRASNRSVVALPAILALRRHGRQGEADAVLAALDDRTRDRVTREQARLDKLGRRCGR